MSVSEHSGKYAAAEYAASTRQTKGERRTGNMNYTKKRIFNILLCVILIFTVSGSQVQKTAFAASEPDVTGTSAMIYCATTDELLWEKNADEKLNLASITKLMTCLIAAEELGLSKKITVDEEATKVDKAKSAVYAGEEITVEDLIYEALLTSANDAAKALGIAVSGTQKDFAKLMNARAQKIGCTNTHFANASGVKAAGYECTSTARDVILIAREAFKNEDIRRIAGTAKYTLPATNKNEERELETTNLFLEGGEADTLNGKFKVKKYEGVFAGKTGTTPEYKTTMVVGCDIDGFEVYAVIMNSTLSDRYSDIRTLLNFARRSISKYTAFEKGTSFGETKLKGGATNKVEAIAKEAGYINLPEGASAALVTTRAVYNDDLKAPIKKGQTVGKVEIYLADDYIRSIELSAANDIKEGWFLSGLGVTNFQTVLILLAVFLILGLYITIIVLRAINRKKRKAERQAKLKRIAMQQLERERDVKQRNWPY